MKFSIELTGFNKPHLPTLPKIKKPSTKKPRKAIISLLQRMEKSLEGDKK